MSRGVEDTALLQAPMDLGKDGMEAILDYWNTSTHEVKNLLANECDVMFECRHCRNVFRSLINFISHKRGYCRTLYGRQNEAISKVVAQFTEDVATQLAMVNDENARSDQQVRRTKGLLKRTNIVGVLNRRIERCEIDVPKSGEKLDLMTLPRIGKAIPETTFENGEQVFESMPDMIAMKERELPTRTTLVIPQDNTVQYGEMNLRRRRHNQKDNLLREIGQDEMKFLDSLEKFAPKLVDFGSVKCLHDDCKEKLPFCSIKVLAYHLTVKHNYRSPMDNSIYCFVCGCHFQRYAALVGHLEQVHEEYHKDHLAARVLSAAEKEQKRTKKPKVMNKNAVIQRSRSLSPLPADFIADEVLAESDVSAENYPEASSRRTSFCADTSDQNMERSDDSENSDCSSLGKSERSSDDNRTLAEFRNEFMQVNQALVNEAANQNCGLSDVIRLLQVHSCRKAIDELDIGNSNQAVLDCVENIVDEVCSLEAAKQCGSAELKEKPLDVCGEMDHLRHEVEVKEEVLSVEKPVGRRARRTKEVDDRKMVNGDLRSAAEIASTVKKEVVQPADSAVGSCTLEHIEMLEENILDPLAILSPEEISQVKAGTPDGSEPLAGLPVLEKMDTESSEQRPVLLKEDMSDIPELSKAEEEGDMNEAPRKGSETDSSVPSSTGRRKQRRKEIKRKRLADLMRARQVKKTLAVGSFVKGADSDVQSEFCDSLELPEKKLSSEDEAREDTSDSLSLSNRVGQVENVVASNGRPVRQRRKPEWIEKHNFMTDDYGKKTLTRRSDGSDTSALNAASIPRPDSAASTRSNEKLNVQKKLIIESRLHYTPRARKRKFGDAEAETDPSEASTSNGINGKTAKEATANVERVNRDSRHDLSIIPVYLTEAQRELFFSFIVRSMSATAPKEYICRYCNEEFQNLTDGRKHAVGHLRIMRLRCKLCGCGSFFCSDMRNHLQMRYCEMLCSAPEGYVVAGNKAPCMTDEQADDLIEAIDKAKPGRIMFTSGKIISATSLIPYYPDAKIEEKILGTTNPTDLEKVAQSYIP